MMDGQKNIKLCREPLLGSNRMGILLILHVKLQLLCAAWCKRKLSSALAILISKRYGRWKTAYVRKLINQHPALLRPVVH